MTKFRRQNHCLQLWMNCRTYLVPKDRSKPIVTQTTILISVGYKKNKNKEKVKEEKRDRHEGEQEICNEEPGSKELVVD